VPVLALPGFEDGDISVQDEAPQQAAELLNPQAGETVLDACAAPGGKTAHILERIAAAGEGELKELVALDLKPERLQRIDDNLARLNFTASTVVADATDSGWRKSGSLFDRILIDAPCSGSGVIRRNPDIKLLRRQSDIVTLVDNQRAILESCWALLQSGGTLLYATCSIFPQENEEQIQQFLNAQQDSEALPIEQEWGRSTGAGRQILPGENGMDGFYYALLRKRVE
jgi:16S rRNA (cytosine967-C5)-methyltransferase